MCFLSLCVWLLLWVAQPVVPIKYLSEGDEWYAGWQRRLALFSPFTFRFSMESKVVWAIYRIKFDDLANGWLVSDILGNKNVQHYSRNRNNSQSAGFNVDVRGGFQLLCNYKQCLLSIHLKCTVARKVHKSTVKNWASNLSGRCQQPELACVYFCVCVCACVLGSAVTNIGYCIG